LSEEDKLTALALVDPVTWAAKNLDWHCIDPDGEIWKRKNPNEYYEWKAKNPDTDILGHSRYHRPYQSLMLQCSARYKVARCGRQCLPGDSEIYLWNGTKKNIQDVNIGDEIYSLNLETQKLEKDLVKDKWNTGRKDIYKIKTRFGKTIRCSINHSFYTVNKILDKFHGITIDRLIPQWLSIEDGLKKGDKIATPFYIENHIQTQDLEDIAILLGYFLTDGSSSTYQSSKFTNNNMNYKLEFEQVCNKLGSSCKWYAKNKGHDLIISNGRGKDNPVRNLLEKLGLINITGPQKFIPEIIMNASDEIVKLFLTRFWAGDGYISTWQRTGRKTFKTEIGNLQESLRMIKQLKLLLLRFKIHSYIKKEGNAYRLVVSNKFSIINFLENIKNIPDKEPQSIIAKEKIMLASDLFFIHTNDILWDYISSIEKLGQEETYDIETEKNHNFIADEIITHNSGKTDTLVVQILYHLFVKPGKAENEGFTVILITPYQSQIDLIFKRLEELIKSNQDLQNSIKRNVKAPNYQIELWNGSIIKGFTAGTKSGGNADAVRGNHGDYLIFDEGDYLAPKDIESALSVITNSPNAQVWMSSTPTGKHEKFYATCHSPLYREFHYTSHENPLWTTDLDQHFREQMTSIAYDHEVNANFGVQAEGVFQNTYIQLAKADFKYTSLPFDPNWIYTMGVDWNDIRNGTTIAVVGYSPTTNHFFMVDRAIVRKEGWTQLAACERIAEFNRIWNPVAIYVDKGYGSTQFEILKKFGYDSTLDPTKGHGHPDSKLKTIVHQYDFGSKVKIRDLFTQQEVEKPAKPFLVENAMRRFETKTFSFPESDKDLEAQLLGYIIDHISPTGTPTFKAGNAEAGDHLLDALMLAFVAFTLTKTPFGKPIMISKIGFSGYFGEKNNSAEAGNISLPKDPKRIEETKRDKLRPEYNRDNEVKEEMRIVTSSSQHLPASHLNENANQQRIYTAEAFNSDKPLSGKTNSRFQKRTRSDMIRRKNI
jgi:intein/homing endonuclease